MARNKKRRHRRRRRERVKLKLALLLGALVLLGAGLYALTRTMEGPPQPEPQGESVVEETILWNGEEYRAKRRVNTILFIGTDRTDDMGEDEVLAVARTGGQADFIFIIVMDAETDKVYSMHINRDTMAEIAVTDGLGHRAGTTRAQICLSYGFGMTGRESREMTAEAVSALLNGVSIDHTLVLNMENIGALNDAVGGVTVRVEDDLTAYDPELARGNTVTLNSRQAEYFVRSRMNVGEGSNAERMVRQRVYLAALRQALQTGMREEGQQYLGRLFGAVKEISQTDMSVGFMINTLWNARRYEWSEILAPQGTYAIGEDGFVEFTLDEESLRGILMDIYYRPVSG